MFSFQKDKNQYQGFFLAQHNGRRSARQGETITGAAPCKQPKSEQMTVMFFTDRAIYRPGQTIQFKGIALAWHQGKNDYNIMPDRKITVMLRDPNREEVERLDLKTNGYGSLSGSFTAPKGRLTGNFQIATTAVPHGQVYFRVEEYKRPKFLVELGKPEQSPKLGDTVQLNGKAPTTPARRSARPRASFMSHERRVGRFGGVGITGVAGRSIRSRLSRSPMAHSKPSRTARS